LDLADAMKNIVIADAGTDLTTSIRIAEEDVEKRSST